MHHRLKLLVHFITVAKLLKSIRNKIFILRWRDLFVRLSLMNSFQATSSSTTVHSWAKDKTLLHLHENFNQVLQVLLHVLQHHVEEDVPLTDK